MNNIAKKLFALGSAVTLALSFMTPMVAKAAVHAVGTNVNASGTIWMIMPGNCRAAYTSAGAFTSYGFNSWSGVVTASAEDLALPVCAQNFIPPQDGQIIISDRGADMNTAYFISGGQKRGFVSRAVYDGSGFPASRLVGSAAVKADVSWMTSGAHIENAAAAHLPGALINKDGTILLVVSNGLLGIPDLATFGSWGYSFSNTVMANAADRAMAMVGVMAMRQPGQLSPTAITTPNPSGPVSVSLAASNPASSTLVAGQALADLAHFSFTGSGTITSLTFERIGVSANTTPSNVYLFDGTTRLTDSASFGSDSKATFAGLNLSVPRTISVKSDIASGTSGQTVGIKLVSYTTSGNAAASASVSGNLHTVATASLATVAMASATGTGNTDPGSDINVWQGNATVGTRDVTLNRLALRQIGSIQNNDIRNFRLFVDGVQVATVANLDANGYVTFSPSVKLMSGTRVLKVLADIVGGSGRTVEFDLRGAYDIGVIDSSYQASVLATGTFPFGPASFTVNAGTMVVVKATDSPSSNETVGGSDVSVGKWTLTAYGEAIKVETLTVGVDTTGGTTADHTLRNGRILINGAQYGSTADVAAVDSFASGQSYTVNYTVPAGQSATVEFRADMFDSEGTNEIAAGTVTAVQAALIGSASSNNAVPQVSLGTIDVPGSNVTANTLGVTSGTISLTALASYPNQTTAVPQSSYKLAQWTLNGNSSEAVNLNTFDVGFAGADAFSPSGDLTNVFLKVGGINTSIKGTVADGSSTSLANSYSYSHTLAKNESLNVELWASIGANATNGDGTPDTMIAYLRVTGITQSSGTTVYADTDSDTDNTDAGKAGQTITAASGSMTEALHASSPVAMNTDDNKTVTAAAYQFTAASDTFAIDEVNVDLAGATSVTSVVLKDGATVLQTKSGATDVTFSGLSFVVPANSTKALTVDLVLGNIGTGAGTSGEDVKVTLDHYYHTNSSGTRTQDTTNVDANSVFVYAGIPTVTEVAIPNVDPTGTVDVAKWTVSATGGTVAIKQFGFSSVITEAGVGDATLTAGTFKLFRDGTDITDQVGIVNASGATIEATNTLGEGTAAGYILFSSEETISGGASRTYTLRSTLGGAWATGDSIRVEMNSDSSVANTISYLDGVGGTSAAVAELVTSGGASDTGALNLIWSDVSAIPHATTVTDDSASPTSSGDWNNGYLVKNLPITGWTLTY